MGTLYLVRHGQASFGADDYDNLSELGVKQSVRLGEYWRGKGIKFDAVLTGTLKRQIQTYAGICEGMGQGMGQGMDEGAGFDMQALPWPGLNEYDSHAVIEAIHPQPLQKPDTPELYRHHFRLLRDGLTQWMNGVVSPKGMPSYPEFLQGITSALDHVRGLPLEGEQGNGSSGNVLIVSSGGPISTAVGHILGTTPETTIELNLRIRNSSVTEFSFNPKRHMLVTYNTLPHLDAPEHAGWVTYA
jgi:broad specificity phosphatase PhoE